MIVRLTQLDGKLPNLALMKLAHWHRARGDEVRFTRSPYRGLDEPAYDRVYGSAIFSFTAARLARFLAEFPGAVVGGTGTDSKATVEQAVRSNSDDYERYDYSIYPDFAPSIGFTARGCRLKCKFCVVPEKEGKPRAVNTVADIWRGEGHPRHLHLLDNDFFGQADWRERVAEIRAGRFKVCLNQGINVRLINDEAAAALASIDYRDDQFGRRRLYTAWDNLKDERVFIRGVEMLERAGIPPTHLLVYMLVGFDREETWERVLHRFGRMVERGMRPYPMIYGNKLRTLPLGNAARRIETRRLTLGDFQRWAVRSSKLGVPFHEYDAAAKGWASDEQGELWGGLSA